MMKAAEVLANSREVKYVDVCKDLRTAPTVILTSSLFCVCFQGESVKNSSGTGDEAQAAAGGRTRSVRSLGTAELIRPQRLKYFESMLPSHRIYFLWTLLFNHVGFFL